MFAPVIASLLLGQGASEHLASVQDSNRLAAKIVDHFNLDDAAGIQSMALPEFFRTMPRDRFPGLIHQVNGLGTLLSPSLVLDLGEERQYRITIKKDGKPGRSISMILGAESDSSFFFLSLGPYSEKLAPTKIWLSDNHGSSVVEKAIKDATQHYLEKFAPAGVSIGVIDAGRKTFVNYGNSSMEGWKMPTSQTVYEIGSITKTMTGFLIAQAIRDHKLNLDDDIRSHLPGTFSHLEFEGKPILVRHLVTHTSGLPANPPGIPDDGKANAYEQYNHKLLLTDLASIKLTRAPGSIFGYSNMGAGLCSLILEQVYGNGYENLLKKALFDPYKMTSSGLTVSPSMNIRYATPFDKAGAKTDRWVVNGIEAAGALHSTCEDMLKYAQLSLDEKNPIVALTHTKVSTGDGQEFGIFWLLGHSRLGGHFVNHEGGTGGFTSHILVMPERKLAVVVLMNSGEQNAGELAREIALRILYHPGR